MDSSLKHSEIWGKCKFGSGLEFWWQDPHCRRWRAAVTEWIRGKIPSHFFPRINCSPLYKYEGQAAISTSSRPAASGCCHRDWWPSAVLNWGGGSQLPPTPGDGEQGYKMGSTLKWCRARHTTNPCVKAFCKWHLTPGSSEQQRIHVDLPTHLSPHMDNKISHHPICKENFLSFNSCAGSVSWSSRTFKENSNLLC